MTAIRTTIRVFGDPVLHQAPERVDFQHLKWDLDEVLHVMRAEYTREAGVGIAANQCAALQRPPQIIIVGSADDGIKKRRGKRYPGEHIPEPIIMINPEIIEYSTSTYFPAHGEGCLSVPSALRGQVARHEWVIVRYQDIEGVAHQEKYSGFTAHIVQHECDHLNGLVYVEKILQELDDKQKNTLLKLCEEAKQLTTEHKLWPPALGFSSDGSGNVVMDEDVLLKELGAIDKSVLAAIVKKINRI